MRTLLVGALAAIGLTISACGEIKDQSSVKTASTAVNGQYIAGVGDAILTIQNSESLPNVVGGADIFGRTRPTGTTTVFFTGIRGGKAQFVRRDVLIQSDKTTMNSSATVINPSSQSSFSGNVGGVPYSGSSNTQAYPIIIPPNTPRDRVAGVRDINIAVAVGQPIVVAGKTATIVSATSNQVSYTLN